MKYRDTYRIVTQVSRYVSHRDFRSRATDYAIEHRSVRPDRSSVVKIEPTANVTVLFARQAATDDALSDRHPGSRLEQRPQDVTRVRVLHVESELSTEERAQLAQHLDQAPLACDRRSVHLNKLSRGSHKKAFKKEQK